MGSDLKTSQSVKSPMLPGFAVLMVILAVCGWIFYRQLHFNPAVLAMRPEVPGFAPGLQADSMLFPVPETVLAAAAQRFESDNLSDKIDGKAELYLAAGFKSLTAQRFRPVDLTDQWVEAFFYEMQDTAGAFSVYSLQRREDARPSDVSGFSYETPNAIFLVHGLYYVELIASDVQPQLKAAARSLARAFVASYSVSEKRIPEAEIFPRPYRASDEIKLLSAPVFGCECLDKIYTAQYEIQGVRMTAFLARQESEETARNLAINYREFLVGFGAQELDLNIDIPGVYILKIFDALEAVFTHGRYLVGVHEAPDEERLKVLAQALYQGLSEADDGA